MTRNSSRQKKSLSLLEEEKKVKEEIREIEDIVERMLYFAHRSSDAGYIHIMVTNFSKRLLDFLSIEYKDVEHIFRHEIEHHNYAPHSLKEKAEYLHKKLKKESEKIKKLASSIPRLSSRLAEGKMSRDEFNRKIEETCSAILKTAGSEKHELEFVKRFISGQPAK